MLYVDCAATVGSTATAATGVVEALDADVATLGAKLDNAITSACKAGAASEVVTALSNTEVFTVNARAPAASTPVTERTVAMDVFIEQTLLIQVQRDGQGVSKIHPILLKSSDFCLGWRKEPD
jgi:hypothetical protein